MNLGYGFLKKKIGSLSKSFSLILNSIYENLKIFLNYAFT